MVRFHLKVAGQDEEIEMTSYSSSAGGGDAACARDAAGGVTEDGVAEVNEKMKWVCVVAHQ